MISSAVCKFVSCFSTRHTGDRMHTVPPTRCQNLQERPKVLEVEALHRLLDRRTGFDPPPCLSGDRSFGGNMGEGG